MTKQYARESEIIRTSEYKKFFKEVRAIFIKCVKYLRTSLKVLKNDVIKSLTCYEWEPTKSILGHAKSATYKNLHAREKQQQQAAANENPED